MAADTAAKRYSAMHLTSPWRGLNVVPDAAIPQGERQAVMFMYSGILAAASNGTSGDSRQFVGEIQSLGIGSIMDASMGVV
jgi:hypothetical protein